MTTSIFSITSNNKTPQSLNLRRLVFPCTGVDTMVDSSQITQGGSKVRWSCQSSLGGVACTELRHQHGVIISKRTLQRLCRKLNLFRRKNQTDIEEIASFVQSEMATSGRLQGYRWLHLCAIRRGYVVSQETMRKVIKEIDPEGVELRRARRLRICHNATPRWDPG